MHVYPNYYKKNYNYIKKNSPHKYKKVFCLVNIRMINLSFDELRQIRNISNYENKSKEDLIKALREPKPETPKSETKPKQTSKPKPEPKIDVKVNKKRLEKTRKDFDEFRHKFSKKEIKEYRKAFYVAKNKKYFSNNIGINNEDKKKSY